jgi:hypothetical protein
MHTGLWWKILQERDFLDVTDVNGRVISQQILKDEESEGVDWIHLDQDTNQWQVVVTTLKTFRFHK